MSTHVALFEHNDLEDIALAARKVLELKLHMGEEGCHHYNADNTYRPQ